MDIVNVAASFADRQQPKGADSRLAFSGRTAANFATKSLPVTARRWAWGCLAIVSTCLAGASAADEPRIALIDLQLSDDHSVALQVVEQELQQNPQASRRLGFDYLRGHLLLHLDRRKEAVQAFAQTMGSTPPLAPYSRFLLAREQESLGNPQVAAGLIATLLSSDAPSTLVDESVLLLERSIEAGGDCRLLRNLDRKSWGTTQRRRLTRLQAICAQRAGDLDAARDILFMLLEEKRDDDIALNAVHGLVPLVEPKLPVRQHWLMGMTFYRHRQFDIAMHHLARTLVQLASTDAIDAEEAFECRYALARSHFWLGHYQAAADAFGALAASSRQARRKAQCFYQRGRSLELGGAWPEALQSFDRALQADPRGRWADASLIAAMRLHWLRDEQQQGLQKLQGLKGLRSPDTTTRALMFLISTDIVEGRSDRADGWLQDAQTIGRASDQELAYWRGRLAELRGDWNQAVLQHVAAMTENTYHPYGVASRQRLGTPRLLAASQQYRVRWQHSKRPEHLYAAFLLSRGQEDAAWQVRRRLETLLLEDSAVAPFLTMAMQPTAEWPLWQSSLSRPEDMLLALGIFDQPASMVLRHFPVSKPSLALTGSRMLSGSGATRRSLYMAEVLAKRIPKRLPPQLLSTDYRRLLFPFRYSYLILKETQRRQVDPYLLAALIREESRFDHRAFSGAAARGLTQFVLPTAERIAKTYDLGPIQPQDLERPEVAIALGAAYLRQLMDELDGSLPQTIAAYNAGEPQSALWRRYCSGDELEEYLAKVSFKETRNYLIKVLTSREHYSELYGPPASDPPPAATDGRSDRRDR